MHRPSLEDESTVDDIGRWIKHRLAFRDETLPPRRLAPPLPVIGPVGVGTRTAWAILRDEVLPTAVPSDHPRYLAFVAQAPSVAAVLADLAVSASGVYAGGTLDGGSVIAAERAALRWLADLAGLPATAHGAFVSGGSIANLSALVAARQRADDLRAAVEPNRGAEVILTGTGAHSSVWSAAKVMGCSVRAAGDLNGRLDQKALRLLLDEVDVSHIIAVVATAGATNTGAIDDLKAVAEVCAQSGLWLHIDAAYGAGALLAPGLRSRFDGIELCDSITMDPHKWLFTPYDCGAVIYRDPELARRAHAQSASYLDVYDNGDNPADYAIHLSRRARGIPLWASLVANGVQTYQAAVERCLELANYAADRVRRSDYLDLIGDPSLSVVLLQRTGWKSDDYERWSQQSLASGLAMVTSTRHDGRPVLRLCFVNPITTEGDVDLIFEALK